MLHNEGAAQSSILITTREILHVINILHVIIFFELRTPDVALCTCIIIYYIVSFELYIYKIYYMYNNMARAKNYYVYNNIVCVQSVHTCTIKWYINKVCYMYRFMFVMCPICYRTNMFYNTSTFLVTLYFLFYIGVPFLL